MNTLDLSLNSTQPTDVGGLPDADPAVPEPHTAFRSELPLDSVLMPVTSRPAQVMVRGAGSYLYDESGRRYLDFIQGWAVNVLGHCPPEVADALTRQARTLITPSPALHNGPQLQLAQRLTELSGLAAVHFVSSGAEANETAVKLARKWGRLHRAGAHEIITTGGAFHGRTLAMMAASGKPAWQTMFPPASPGFRKVPFGSLAAMRAAIDANTAAIMVEPIQGEGGVVVPPADYLPGLRRLADESGVLLMLDEIQTGMGRTGTLFHYQQHGVIPDILTLGKGLGGGVPIAAVLAGHSANCFEHGEQGGTYNGNPLVCAVALALLEIVATPAFLQTVCERATQLADVLAELALRGGLQVRGAGLLQALVGAPAAELRDQAWDRSLVVNAAQADVVRLMPSLRVSAAEIDEFGHIMASLPALRRAA